MSGQPTALAPQVHLEPRSRTLRVAAASSTSPYTRTACRHSPFGSSSPSCVLLQRGSLLTFFADKSLSGNVMLPLLENIWAVLGRPSVLRGRSFCSQGYCKEAREGEEEEPWRRAKRIIFSTRCLDGPLCTFLGPGSQDSVPEVGTQCSKMSSWSPT